MIEILSEQSQSFGICFEQEPIAARPQLLLKKQSILSSLITFTKIVVIKFTFWTFCFHLALRFTQAVGVIYI